jgi:hypothetical protein
VKKYPRKHKTKTSSDLGLEHGFRSGLEDLNAKHLIEKGQKVSYEEHSLEYSQPAKLRKYTPDFILSNGIVVETKGRFLTQDRQKHLMIKLCHPDLDIRFVFSNPNQTISKQSKTTYADWCRHKGFQCAAKVVPTAWIAEPPTVKRLNAANRALKWRPK